MFLAICLTLLLFASIKQCHLKHICIRTRRNEVQNVVFALWKALLQASYPCFIAIYIVAMCHRHIIIHNSLQQNSNWVYEGVGNVSAVSKEAGGPQVIYGHHVPVVP